MDRVRTLPAGFAFSSRSSAQPKIPRKLHMIWVGASPRPASVNDHFEKWSALMPSWEIKLWTDRDVDLVLKDRAMFDACMTGAQKADILRMHILMRFGGFYVDADVMPKASLDAILEALPDSSLVACHNLEITWAYVANAFMGAEAGHPCVANAVERLERVKINTAPVFMHTGPRLWGEAVEWWAQSGGETVALAPGTFYNSSQDRNPKCDIEFGTHLYAASFLEEERDLDFIEIGTSDFDTLIQTCDEDARGISVDAMKMYLDRLPEKKNVKKIHAAVSDVSGGSVRVFFVHPDDIEEHGLPNWVRGCNSIDRPHATVTKLLSENHLVHLMRLEMARCIDFGDLLKENDVRRIKFLKLDCEGHDCVILRGVVKHCRSNPVSWPEKILFEANELTPTEVTNDTISTLVAEGYVISLQTGTDVTLHRS